MKVTDLMTGEIVSLPRNATVAQTIELMVTRKVSSVLVEREEAEEPWGIVTRSDIVYKVAARDLDPTRMTLGEVMSPALLTIDPALDVGYANRLMRRFGIRHLLVLQRDELIGVLSYHDVLRVFNLLRSVSFFERLSIDELIALLSVSSVRQCRGGEVLIQEGDPGRDLFVLEEGEMIVSTRRAGRIARIRAGELFGEMELFGGSRSATVRAARDSRILRIDGERFVELASARDHLGAVVFESMSRLLSARLRRANRFLFLRGIWTHRALVLRILAISALAFIILVFGTATVSETPSFCKTCHNMLPYQASWSASPHREVNCTKCHWSYGLRGAVRGKITGVAMVVRYVTHTYGPKPEARVDDTSCLRSKCHSPGIPAPRYKTVDGDSVRFDHALHLNPQKPLGKLRCTSCHSHRGQDEHFSVTASTCFLCHFPGSEAPPTPCLGCHDFKPPEGGASLPLRVNHAAFGPKVDCLACHRNVTLGSGIVQEERCTACHLRPDSLATGRMHRVHVLGEDIDCFDCHASIDHPGPSDRILAGRCDACHAEPHAAQERLYLGEGGVGVAGRPALMFYYHVECTACHQVEAVGADSVRIPAHADQEEPLCLDCHDVTFPDRMRMWNVTLGRSLERVEGLLSRAEAGIGSGGAARNLEALRIYEAARRNYEIVAADPSAWIHNYRYADDLLRASEKKLADVMTLLGSTEGGKP